MMIENSLKEIQKEKSLLEEIYLEAK